METQHSDHRERMPRGERCFLAHASASDEGEFLAAVGESADLHGPWVQAPSTAEAFAAFLERARHPDQISLLVRRIESGDLAGVINISQVVRGLLQSSYLGFYAFRAASGQGLMREGLALALHYYFETLGLHRIEANVQPGNSRSLALVRRLGFRHEGFSLRYLFIDGAWRDHERFAMTVEDFASIERAAAS